LSLKPTGALVKQLAAVIVGLMFVSFSAWGQEPHLAPEGHGLLPGPTTPPPSLEGVPGVQTFQRDPSGTFSQIVFETDEGRDFHLVIRDFIVAPDQQTHSVTLPTVAVLQVLSDAVEVSVAKQLVQVPRVAAAAAAPTPLATVPAGAPIDLTNRGEVAAVVRVYQVEAKQP
jgi:hypothetical protein